MRKLCCSIILLLIAIGGRCDDIITNAAASVTNVTATTATIVSILPSATDPRIETFDYPHSIYINRDIIIEQKTNLPSDRHQLLLWLPGTGGRAQNAASGFCSLAADLGYHVVSLMYPDDFAASVCANDTDTNAFENFRLAIIQGGVAMYHNGRENRLFFAADSITNRLVKLLLRLKEIRPREDWGQFLDTNNSINWESIAVAGQSQGGGHAALIGIKHPVARVICFGSPKDFSKKWNAPAAWYSEQSATPKNRFFAFNHRQDPNSCTPEQMLENIKALGLQGEPLDVESATPPYRHARVLYTSYPKVVIDSADGDGAKIAHSAGINTKYAARWKPVWTYLLTEDVR